MKNIFRLALLSILSLSLLTSCCKLGFKKNCSANCHQAKVEETTAPVAPKAEEKPVAKKVKKAKKAKKTEVAPANAPAPAVETKTN